MVLVYRRGFSWAALRMIPVESAGVGLGLTCLLASLDVSGLGAPWPLSLSPGGISSSKTSPSGLGFSQNRGLGKDAFRTGWLASKRWEINRSYQDSQGPLLEMAEHAFCLCYWSNLPSLRPTSQAFHPYVLLVEAVSGSTQIQESGAVACSSWWE